MSLQRRLLLYLLVSAPLVWALALSFAIVGARHSVNELFDTELIRLARQIQVLVHSSNASNMSTLLTPNHADSPGGEADLKDMAIAVWNTQGQLLVSDREGADLPWRPTASGFIDEQLGGQTWRLYYLPSKNGQWLVASGQKSHERDELVFSLTATQIVPWLLVLPVLLMAMTWAVRRALAPVHDIAFELEHRSADDLQAVTDAQAPAEIKPLLTAMNSLFLRIEATFTRERRFTADAAHELRTPLAALRAQWDVMRHSVGNAERQRAESKVGIGLDRMERLVTQMLALSRVEAQGVAQAKGWSATVAWPVIVEQAISDCLPLADRRHIEIACDWPADPTPAMPMRGDDALLTVLLRNLLDNAVRYAPAHTLVTLRFAADHLAVENDGPALPQSAFARLGERFHRPEGQPESGSGLGISIARRIADLHGLRLSFSPAADEGTGMRVVLARPDSE